MDYEQTEHVAAPPERVYAALSDVGNLSRFVPQITSVRPVDTEHVAVEARYEGQTQHGTAWLRTDEAARRVEWGVDDAGYRGSLAVADGEGGGTALTLTLHTERAPGAGGDVAATFDAVRRLLEAEL